MNELSTYPTSIHKIQKRVAEYFEIPLLEMRSARRSRSVAMPRQVAMHLSRKLTRYSLPVIGDCFNKDHTTIMHADTNIKSLIPQDLKLEKAVNILSRELADVDEAGVEISYQLAVDTIVKVISARLRRQLIRLAVSDPVDLAEILQNFESPDKESGS